MTGAIDIRIGDVVMYGERMEPPRFQQVTTDYECRRWTERQSEIAAILRPAWKRRKDTPLPAPEAPETRPEHRCGVQGFNGMLGDVCPACAATAAALQAEPPPADTAAPMPQIQPGDVVRLASGHGQSIGVMEALLLNGLASKEHIDMIERPYGVTLWRRGSRTP